MKETDIYYVRESFIQSFLSDTYSAFILCGSVYFNYKMCGNSGFLNGIILIIFILSLITRRKTKQFNTNAELIEYLEEVKE